MKWEEIRDRNIFQFLQKEMILLILIVVLGAFLRLCNLMYYPSYHHDEGVFYEYGKNMIEHGELRLFNVNMLSHPPLIIFLTGIVSITLNLGFFGARLTSALFGILCIPLVYLIGKKLYGYKVGLLGALFISTSITTVLINRMYYLDTSVEFFFLLTFFFLLRYFDKSTFANACILGLCCGLALLSKLTGISTLIFLYFCLLYHKKPIKHLMTITILAFLLLSVYALIMYIKNQSFDGISFHVEQSKGYTSPLYTLFNPTGIPNEASVNKSLYLVPGIISFILMTYRRKKEDFLIIFAFISIVMTLILQAHIVPRYFPVLMAVISIILSKFLYDSYKREDRLIIFAILFIIPISYIAVPLATRTITYIYQLSIIGTILVCILSTRYLSDNSNRAIFKAFIMLIILTFVIGMAYPHFFENSNLDADMTIDYIKDNTNKTDYILSNPLIASLVDCNALSYYYRNPESEVNITIFKYIIHDVNDEIDFLTQYNRMESIQNWTIEEHFDDFVIYRNPDR